MFFFNKSLIYEVDSTIKIIENCMLHNMVYNFMIALNIYIPIITIQINFLNTKAVTYIIFDEKVCIPFKLKRVMKFHHSF